MASPRATTDPGFLVPLPIDEIREFQRIAEARLETYGDGARVSIRASDLLLLVEHLLEARRWTLSQPTYGAAI
jgi:hypothetical protein